MRKKLFILFTLVLCVSFRLSAVDNDGSRYAKNSVLSQGKWYKIKISETGIYKLTYKDLKKIGLSNPQNVKVYGYGGWIINEDFTRPYIDDLPQVSIWMNRSRNDFKNEDDYILFYGRGNIKWTYNKTTTEFEQTQNPYSSNNYYFITESDEDPKLIGIQGSLPLPDNVVTSYNDYVLHEQELVNPGETGREMLGENFLKTSTVNVPLNTEGATTDPAVLRCSFIARTVFTSGKLTIDFNGSYLDALSTSVPLGDNTYLIATHMSSLLSVNALQNQNTVKLTYTKGYTSDKNVYLNYLRLNYKRNLKPYGAVTLFRNTTLASNLGFKIASASSDMLVFDVTSNTVPIRIDAQLSGSTLQFAADNNTIKEYAMVDLAKLSDIPTPTYEGKGLGAIANQNLHALESADMVIIVRDFLKSYAQQLADLHNNESGLTSIIVSPEDIYNEFSSGKPDASAYRRFMKMFYDRADGGENRPQYLMLFGGGTFDNQLKQDWADEASKSMLLTYQSENYLTEVGSYVSDDYFGLLDDRSVVRTEEPITSTNPFDSIFDLSKAKLDISIGRLPVRSASSAANTVAKIAAYIENKNKGIWQNNITFVADDAVAGSNSTESEREHMQDAERFSAGITASYPDFVVSKIYEDAYERVIESGGARYPDANRALLDRINKGTLMLNFIGHGSTTSWTHEYLLTMANIESLNNDKLPLWITATCDFGRFDANASSGGEAALLKEEGGAIAMMTTVRAVYIRNNRTMNESLMKYLFKKKNGKNPRLGDILREAKNDALLFEDSNKLRFVLLGDPALTLAYPEDTYKVRITEMNDRDADADDINIQALDNTVIKGIIENQNGDVAEDFNGTLESLVFDAKQTLRTRGNTSSGTPNPDKIAIDYTDYTNTLFAGKVDIMNGEFVVNFVAPKDILYADDKGKMSFYAYDNSDSKKKAQGSFYNYTIGGTNTNMPEEENPPVISKMFLNNEQFKDGGYVNSTPLFYAEVSDDTGINLSNAIGHNISLVLDGITTYDLSSYFTNKGGSNKEGSISFQMPQMSEGEHKIEFRIWDVFNNSAAETLRFVVTDDYAPSIYSFEIWGNPAKDATRFVINTNTPQSNVDIILRVYSLTGALVWMTQKNQAADTLNRYIYEWDLNTNGGRLQPGVYICSVQVNINGRLSSVKAEKLIVTAR